MSVSGREKTTLAALALVAGVGAALLASPDASADPMSDTAHDVAQVCRMMDAAPYPVTILVIGADMVTEGIESGRAVELIAYAIDTACPEYADEFVEADRLAGQAVANEKRMYA